MHWTAADKYFSAILTAENPLLARLFSLFPAIDPPSDQDGGTRRFNCIQNSRKVSKDSC